MRYCIWNNKGGVGKTFLTYCLAVEYAIKNPKKQVVVIDMCPQANVSEMLLGGNGEGENNLSICIENERSVASYIKSRYDKSRFSKLGNELGFFVKVNEYNAKMPTNLWLLPGDTDLDVCSNIIDYFASAPEKNAWMKSRKILSDLIESFELENKNKENIYFIDCNPSFANYTQLAMIASDRLISPCTGDFASIRGIYNIFRLLYGIKEGKNLSEENIFDLFNEKVKAAGLNLPKVHCFTVNKSRVNDSQATVAYKAHITKIEAIIKQLKTSYPEKFTNQNQEELILNVKDGNNLALVVNHDGLPISSLKHQKYTVYGEETQVNQSQITPFLKNISDIVNIL